MASLGSRKASLIMKIAPNVYLVASGHMGFDLTNAYDCNVYLFDAGDKYILFDTGAGLAVPQILDICEQDGIDLSKINHLLLTHAHADHSGGANELLEHLNLHIYASQATSEIVHTGDETTLSLDVAKESGLYPKNYQYKPFLVNQVFKHNDLLTIGKLSIQVIYTPGHSDDHYSFLIKGLDKSYLIAGDAVFHGGKIVLQNTPDCNVPKTIASIRLLNTYAYNGFLPGHMNFSLKNGERHVETACSYIDQFACPPSLS